MDKQALIDKLNSMLEEDRPEEEKLFIKLVQQVWEIDPYVPLYSVYDALDRKDSRYFLMFMMRDNGLDGNEMGLIKQMMSSYGYYEYFSLMDELNEVRDKVW